MLVFFVIINIMKKLLFLGALSLAATWFLFHSAKAAVDFGATYNVTNYRQAGDPDDTLSIQRAINAAGAAGKGTVYLPARTYTISSSIQIGAIAIINGQDALEGYSNIWIHGDGAGQTIVRATNALNASDPLRKNDVFNANNLFTPVGQYKDSIWVSDMTIDASLQNDAFGPPYDGVNFGYSLAAIEFQNVNNARAFNLEIDGCYGNGIVIASINPSISTAVTNGSIDNVMFKNCVRGLLSTYNLAGSVIQFGAMTGGSITNSTFLNSGGPAIDIFNSNGTVIQNNTFTGVGATQVGNGQTKNSIHSDFGLANCTIQNNTMDGAGPILLQGSMVGTFFDANTPTPGPFRCLIANNTLKNTYSPQGYGAITMTAGNTNSKVATTNGNTIQGNVIINPPANAFLLYDAESNFFTQNQIVNAAAASFQAFETTSNGQTPIAVTAHNPLTHNISINSKSVAAQSATITWVTDEMSNSQIFYGTSQTLGLATTLDNTSTTSHSQSLGNLSPNTTYYYQIRSFDATGYDDASNVLTFQTLSGGTVLVGDLNNDCIVNSIDNSILNQHWFTNFALADLNHDGVVNAIDFSLMNANWFKAC